MKFRATGVWTYLILAVLAGCADRPRLRRDPFAVPPSPNATSSGPRDTVRDVSTSPATDDPFLRGTASNSNNVGRTNAIASPSGSDVAAQPDRFPKEDKPVEPVPATRESDPALQFTGQARSQPQADYPSIRRRLDAVNAQNWRTERDEKTGKFTFYCEVPLPGQQNMARAFEASDENELRAMLAVTEAIEEWVRNGQNDG